MFSVTHTLRAQTAQCISSSELEIPFKYANSGSGDIYYSWQYIIVPLSDDVSGSIVIDGEEYSAGKSTVLIDQGTVEDAHTVESGITATIDQGDVLVSLVFVGGSCEVDYDDETDVVNDDENDDEYEVCGDTGFIWTCGTGLHMVTATGDVTTKVPVFQTFAGDQVELNFELLYKASRTNVHGPLGYGWTHTYNDRLESGSGGDKVFRDSRGRQNRFKAAGSGWDSPRGRPWGLAYDSGSDTHTLVDPNGTTRVFNSAGQLTEITDRRGRVTRLVYTSSKLSHIVSPHGRVCELGYTGSYLTSITDPDGKVTTLSYNGDNLLESVTDPNDEAVSYAYDTVGFGGTTSTAWRLTQETLKNGVVLKAEYDYALDLSDRNGSAPDVVRLLDGDDELIAQVTSGAGLRRREDWTFFSGTVVYTDGRNNHWTILRDNLGRQRDSYSPSGDHSGLTMGASHSDNRIVGFQNARGYSRSFVHDEYGNVLTLTDEAGNLHEMEYTAQTLTACPVKTLLTVRETPRGNWEYVYDEDNGDLLEVIDPIVETGTDNTEEFEYTTRSASTGISSAASALGITSLPGRIESVEYTDRNGHITILSYDQYGNLAHVERDADSSNKLETHFTYDAMGRRTEMRVERNSDRDLVTKYEYDDYGRLRYITEDPSGQTGLPSGVTPLNLVTELIYDGHGNLTGLVNPRGKSLELEYDLRNQIIGQTQDPGGLDLLTSFVLDGNGNVVSVTEPESANITTYQYDDQNFLIQSTDAEGYNTVFERDALGNLTKVTRDRSLTTSDKYEVEFEYDALSRMTKRTVAPGVLDLETEIAYTPSGTCGCAGASPWTNLPRWIKDPKGKYTFFHYDALDRRTKVVRKVGTVNIGASGVENPDYEDVYTQLDLDPVGNLLAATNYVVGGSSGSPTTLQKERVEFTYDWANRRLSATAVASDPNDSVTTSYQYDGSGAVTLITPPTDIAVSLTYDGVGRLLEAEDDALIAAFTYDANGNVLTRKTRAWDGSALTDQVFEFRYDAVDRLLEVVDAEQPTSTERKTVYGYDANGNQISSTNQKGITTRYEYDKLNRLVKMIEDWYGTPPSTVPATANTVTEYGHDGVRQTSIKDHDGNETTYEYDAALRLHKAIYPPQQSGQSAADRTVTYLYDLAGNLSRRTDQRGIETEYQYNDLHQLTERAYDTGSATRTETFAFDHAGRLLSAVNDEAQVGLAYDELGRLAASLQQYDGDSASYNVWFQYAFSATNHNFQQNLTYPSGRGVTRTYDHRSQLTAILDDAALPTSIGWTHDPAGRRLSATRGNLVDSAFSYDLNNRLTNITHARQFSSPAAVWNVDYGYDEAGNRLWMKHNTTDLADRSEKYQYDNRDRLVKFERGTLSFGSGGSISITPTSNGGLTRLQDWTTAASGQGLDRRGNWTEYDYASGAMPSTTAKGLRTPNAANEYQRIERQVGGLVLAQLAHYDKAGNLDRLDVLGDMNCDGSITNGDIDAMNLAITNPSSYATTYPACNLLLGDLDGDGNVDADDGELFSDLLANLGSIDICGRTFEYDEENRLTKITTQGSSPVTLLEIKYDALGRRIWSSDAADTATLCDDQAPIVTRHVFAGIETVAEYGLADGLAPSAGSGGASSPPEALPSGWGLQREFLWGDRFPEPLALIDFTDAGALPAASSTGGGDETFYYLHDALGSVVALTDAGDPSASPDPVPGKVIERYTYDPYGRTVIEVWDAVNSVFTVEKSSAIGNPWAWTGQRYDAGVGLYHFLFRSYSPELGRWLQRDPAGYVDGVNLLEYTSGVPTSSVDPLGLYSETDPEEWDQTFEELLKSGEMISKKTARENSAEIARRFLECTGGVGHVPVLDPGNAQTIVLTATDTVLIIEAAVSGVGLVHMIWVNGRLVFRGLASAVKFAGDDAARAAAEAAKKTVQLSDAEQAAARAALRDAERAAKEAAERAKGAAAKKAEEAAAAAPVSEAAGVSARSPVGRTGRPLENAKFQPSRNPRGSVDGREYSRHAFDQMQNRGLTPSVVENTIRNGVAMPGKYAGTTLHYDAVNHVSIITENASGRVVTVSAGRLKGGPP